MSYLDSTGLGRLISKIKAALSSKQDASTAVTHGQTLPVGSTSKGVYVNSSGEVAALSHSLESDVPSNAVFTDTVSSYCGTSTGQAALQNKAVVVPAAQNFTLKVGCIVSVKFDANNTYNATADAPITMNVNNTGAKQIYYNNTATPTGVSTTTFGYANHYINYMYDGTYWVWAGHSMDNNTTYSAMSVNELTTGTAKTLRTVRADYLKQGIEEIVASHNYAGSSSDGGAANLANNIPVNPTDTSNINIWIVTE